MRNLYMVKSVNEKGEEVYRYVVADNLIAASAAVEGVVAVSLVTDMLIFAVDKRH